MLHLQRNTFQLVVASTEDSSYAILMFPQQGLQFLTTPAGGVLQTGFNEGLVGGWFWSRQGQYVRSSTSEQSSISSLPQYGCDVTLTTWGQEATLGPVPALPWEPLHRHREVDAAVSVFPPSKTTSGKKGVWVYEMGSSSSPDITPGATSDLPEEEQRETFRPAVVPAEQQEGPTWTPGVNRTRDPDPEPGVEDLVDTTPQQVTATPTHTAKPTYWDPSRPGFRANPPGPSHPGPSHPPLQPRPADSEAGRPTPPPSLPRPPQLVVVDEDLDVNGTVLELVSSGGPERGCFNLVLQFSPPAWRPAPTTDTDVPPSPTVRTTAAGTAAAAGRVSMVTARTAWQKVGLSFWRSAGSADGT